VTAPAAPYTTPGRRSPVFIAGIEYGSIYRAARETGISAVWLIKSIKINNGAPVVVKNQMAVTRFWIRERIKGAAV
jgi:hypothetical protein